MPVYRVNPVFLKTCHIEGLVKLPWSVVSKNNQTDFSFITILHPYRGFANSIQAGNAVTLKDWVVNASKWKMDGSEAVSLSKAGQAAFFSVKSITLNEIIVEFSATADVFVILKNKVLTVQSIGEKETKLLFKHKAIQKNISLKPGEMVEFVID